MNEQRLRDLKRNTELLILVHILESPSPRLKDVADELGITVQAVSQYIATMRKEGLLREYSGKLRPTRKGMQLASRGLLALPGRGRGIFQPVYVDDLVEGLYLAASPERGEHPASLDEEHLLGRKSPPRARFRAPDHADPGQGQGR